MADVSGCVVTDVSGCVVTRVSGCVVTDVSGCVVTDMSGCVVTESKVFYGQEPPSGESTTTESGVNYQLLAVMH